MVLPLPWESGRRDAVFASCFPWDPVVQEDSLLPPFPPPQVQPSHPHLDTPPHLQALPAHCKDSQTNGEVLLYSLLLGHIRVKGAIPNNGGPPGGTGQDFRPGPDQGRNGETGPFIHVVGACSLPPPQCWALGTHRWVRPVPAPRIPSPDPTQSLGRCVTWRGPWAECLALPGGGCEGGRVLCRIYGGSQSQRDGSSLPGTQETREVVSQQGHSG